MQIRRAAVAAVSSLATNCAALVLVAVPSAHAVDGHWYAWRLHHPRHGALRITSPSFDPLTIDAVAVVR